MPDDAIPPVEVLEHAAFVRRLAFHLLHDDADADDAAQETLTRALEAPPRAGPGVRAWLAQVLGNVVRRDRRRAGRVERRERVAARPEALRSTADLVARNEILGIVTAAVRGLDADHREVVLLRHYEGLAPRDIAARLDVPVATVKSRLARAHERLRARLDEERAGVARDWRKALGGLIGLEPVSRPTIGSGTSNSRSAAAVKGAVAMGIGTKVAIGVGGLALALLAFWRTGGFGPDRVGPADAGPAAPPMAGVTTPARADAPPAPPLAAAPARASTSLPAIAGPTVRGRVVDGKGGAVAGARIASVPDTNASPFAPDEIGAKGTPAFGAVTDAEGRFVVEVERSALFHTILADAKGFAVTAKTDVAAGADVTITLDPTLSLSGVVADLEGTPIVGAHVRALWLVDTMKLERETVSGEGGTYRIGDLVPIPSALHPFRGYLVTGWVEARADGYAPLLVGSVGAATGTAECHLDLTLSRGARMTGKVVRGEDGSPVEGATVVLCSTEGRVGMTRRNGSRFMNPYAPRPLFETTSAYDGSFSFDHVPCLGPHPSSAAGISVTTRHGALGSVVGWKAGFSEASESIELLDDGATMSVTLTLWPVATIAGRVVEADGSISRGAYVSASVKDRDSKASVGSLHPGSPLAGAKSSESDGRFRIDGVPASTAGPTDVVVSVWAPNSPDRRRPVPARAESRRISIRAGESLDVGDVVLPPTEPTLVVPVIVRAMDGKPVVGAIGTINGFLEPSARTDAAGKAIVSWRWTTPSPPRDYTAIFRASGYAPTPATVRFPPTNGDPVIVVMAPSHRVEGRVVVADGTSPVGVFVSVGDGTDPADIVFPPRELAYPGASAPKGRSMPLVYEGTFVDADGRFAFDDLPDGAYHVLAWKERRVPSERAGLTVRALASAVPADTKDLVLRLPVDDSPRTGSISGRTTDLGTGKRLLDPTVSLFRGEAPAGGGSASLGFVGASRASGVDGTGLFTLAGIAVGTYRLVATAGGHRSATIDSIEVRDGETTRLPPIALERGIAVTGGVRGPDGVDWTGRRLRFTRLGTKTPSDVAILATLAADGSYRTAGFEAGAYEVVVPPDAADATSRSTTYLPANGERCVVRDGDAEVRFDVTLAAAGVIALQPSDDRLPPAPWDVKGPVPDAQAKFGAATRVTLRGADGRTVFDRTGVVRHGGGSDWRLTLLPGRYVAQMDLADGTHPEGIVDLSAGAQVTITFAGK